jgi:hypothetical protein
MRQDIDRYRKGDIADGSLTDMASKYDKSIAEAFIDCDAVVLVDVSGSMRCADVRPNSLSYTRYRAACEQLAKLQKELPGKVGVVAFSDEVKFCPSGYPENLGGGTMMSTALKFIKPADGCGIQIILISDGAPNDPQMTMKVASGFETSISTVYIGPDDGDGRLFLKQLADATGGKATRTATDQMDNLSKTVRGLLTA